MSRFNSIGVSGKNGTPNNEYDTKIKTYELPVVAVSSGASQDTGIKAPVNFFQTISAVIVVNTAESTGTTKTVSIGTSSSGASIMSGIDVSTTGILGAPVTVASESSGNFTYTLGSADFAELDAKVIITLLESNKE